MAHPSRARTLIVSLFLEAFFRALRNLDESRSDDASRAPRGSVLAVVAGAASGTKHIWGLCRRPLPGLAGCVPKRPLLNAKALRNASQKLSRAPVGDGEAGGGEGLDGIGLLATA